MRACVCLHASCCVFVCAHVFICVPVSYAHVQLVRNRSFLFLGLMWSIGIGTFNVFITLMQQMLCPYGYSDVRTVRCVYVCGVYNYVCIRVRCVYVCGVYTCAVCIRVRCVYVCGVYTCACSVLASAVYCLSLSNAGCVVPCI